MKTVDAFSDVRLWFFVGTKSLEILLHPLGRSGKTETGLKNLQHQKSIHKMFASFDGWFNLTHANMQYEICFRCFPATSTGWSPVFTSRSLPPPWNWFHFPLTNIASVMIWTCRFKLMWPTKIYVNWLHMKAIYLCICQILKCKLLTTVWIGRLSNWIICY